MKLQSISLPDINLPAIIRHNRKNAANDSWLLNDCLMIPVRIHEGITCNACVIGKCKHEIRNYQIQKICMIATDSQIGYLNAIDQVRREMQ